MCSGKLSCSPSCQDDSWIPNGLSIFKLLYVSGDVPNMTAPAGVLPKPFGGNP